MPLLSIWVSIKTGHSPSQVCFMVRDDHINVEVWVLMDFYMTSFFPQNGKSSTSTITRDSNSLCIFQLCLNFFMKEILVFVSTRKTSKGASSLTILVSVRTAWESQDNILIELGEAASQPPPHCHPCYVHFLDVALLSISLYFASARLSLD